MYFKQYITHTSVGYKFKSQLDFFVLAYWYGIKPTTNFHSIYPYFWFGLNQLFMKLAWLFFYM